MIKLTEEREKELEALCRQFRIDIISILHELQTGHAGGSLSECEILVTLYMECANISIENQYDSGRDRIVLSKGGNAYIKAAGQPPSGASVFCENPGSGVVHRTFRHWAVGISRNGLRQPAYGERCLCIYRDG